MANMRLVRQPAQNECGLCCVSMVASYFGFCQTISYYRNMLAIGRDGATLKDLCIIFENIGLKPEVQSIQNLRQYQFRKKPYIIYLSNNHFVVLKKIVGDKAIVHDPALGRRKINIDELNEKFGGYILTASKTSAFKPFKNNISDFRHILSIVKTVKLRLIQVLVISCIAYLSAIYIPITLQHFIDNIIAHKALHTTAIIMQFIMIFLFFFIFSHLRNHEIIKLQSELYVNVPLQTISHLFKIPYSFYDNRSKGNILFRLGLLSQVQSAISVNFVKIIMSFTSTLVILLYFIIDFIYLTPILLSCIILIGVYVTLANKFMLNIKREEMNAKEQVNSLETEIVVNMFQIRCLNLSDFIANTYNSKLYTLKEYFTNSQKKTLFFNLIIITLNTFLPFLLLLVISLFPFKDSNSIGQLFSIYVLLGMLLSYCTSFFTELSSILLLKASLFYLNDMLDEPQLIESGNKTINYFQDIFVDNISFKYNDTSGFAIQNINLQVKRGEKIAIVGASGSGKTTIIKLLAGLYEPTKGNIKVNGINIEKLAKHSYSKMFSIVPQTPITFDKTIKDNITLDDSSISEDEIKNALKMVNLLNEVELMPMGMNTMISSQGGNLSGGQVQRLALARALVRNPQVLILDEATSSLDSKNEYFIYENLKKRNTSLISISHRISTIMDSDYIYVFDKGKIVESGSHNELIKLHKVYYELFTKQQLGGEANVESICI